MLVESSLDWRLAVALGSLLLAGLAKGITGLGPPLIATPILAVLYGDLAAAIALVIAPTVLTDMMLLARSAREYRHVVRLIPYLLFGVFGILLGAQLLVRLDQTLLKSVLGCLVLVFVVTSWLDLLPRLSPRAARLAGSPLGFLAGALQGAVGASGPVSVMYLLSTAASRQAFLFSINAVFLVLDSTQVAALYGLGLYTADLSLQAVVSALVLVPAVLLGFKLHDRVDDRLFRRGVLLILALTGASLLASLR